MRSETGAIRAVAGLLTGVLMLAGGLVPGHAAAREWGGDHGPGGGAPLARMLKKLDLSSSQKAQVAAILSAQREALAAASERSTAAMAAVMAQLGAETVDMQALGSAHDAAAAARKDALLAWVRVRQDIQAVLTPAQLARAQEMRDSFMRKMEGHRAERKTSGAARIDRLIEAMTR